VNLEEAERIIRLCTKLKTGDRVPKELESRDKITQALCIIVTAMLDDLRNVPLEEDDAAR